MIDTISIILITMELVVMIYTTISYMKLVRQIRAESYTELPRSNGTFVFTEFCMILFVVTYALSLAYVIAHSVDIVYLFITVICAFGAFFSVAMVASQRNMFLVLSKKTQEVMRAFVNTAELKDPRTYGHSQHVRNITEVFFAALPNALKAGISLPRLLDAAYLHDIGKLGIPNAILNKKDPLTSEEWDLIRSHPKMGAAMLRNTCFDQISDWVLYHHERPDGHGYFGLKGDDIPIESRIIFIADSYSAMTSYRSYRERLPHEQAAATMLAESGKQFDAQLVEYFAAIPPQVLISLEPD